MTDTSTLQRFLDPVALQFDDALGEIERGCKRTHWMWFMFPQLESLGRSGTARFYGLAGVDEARAFVRHEVLGAGFERLVAAVHAVVVTQGHRVHDVFGSPDDLKLVSSLTLFRRAAELEGKHLLVEHCDSILAVAVEQGLSPCAVTAAAVAATAL